MNTPVSWDIKPQCGKWVVHSITPDHRGRGVLNYCITVDSKAEAESYVKKMGGKVY